MLYMWKSVEIQACSTFSLISLFLFLALPHRNHYMLSKCLTFSHKSGLKSHWWAMNCYSKNTKCKEEKKIWISQLFSGKIHFYVISNYGCNLMTKLSLTSLWDNRHTYDTSNDSVIAPIHISLLDSGQSYIAGLHISCRSSPGPHCIVCGNSCQYGGIHVTTFYKTALQQVLLHNQFQSKIPSRGVTFLSLYLHASQHNESDYRMVTTICVTVLILIVYYVAFTPVVQLIWLRKNK